MQILRNNRGKISRSRKNRIFDVLNSGEGGLGQSKVYVFFRGGGSSKVYFVDKGGRGRGVKNLQKCVYVFYGRPLTKKPYKIEFS